MADKASRALFLRRYAPVLLELGLDPRRLVGLGRLPRFLADRRRFLRAGGRIDATTPILSDYGGESGVARGHYFHQDLLVASMIHAAAPRRHIDVGSRIDGFVAHVASFREIEVIDVRPLSLAHERIRFLQLDMAGPAAATGIADSVSCLHALEHFGLGRYGDAIDPDGHLEGFARLHGLLEPGGTLYLSVPIGRRSVCFNAQRIFAPGDVLEWRPDGLDLVRFDYVDDEGNLHTHAAVEDVPALVYGCGIYSLRKT
ncbi:MAG: DUF268 domain-containing protein [Caulobacteraceae bacterium]|nr:DUF268 domain-containing protein [Caulobacteraceae bacterium]